MIKKATTYILTFCAIAFLVLSCSEISKVKDAITKPSARQIYKRDFSDKSIFSGWDLAFDRAKSDTIAIRLPYGEKGAFNPTANLVYSYTFSLKDGEALQADISKDSANHHVFIDLFEIGGGQNSLVASSGFGQSELYFASPHGGDYRLIIQPQIGASGSFFFSFNSQPQYAFPVAGKGNASIQSFWADVRDGGRRNHEGIDIFAKRGTPVVAVTDGTVSFTGERGLGGKQVWLRAGLFGNSIYYAHLDSVAVTSGIRVKTGDTLGFVGNTGNARTTPPHLHFGIYKSRGAVNPLPFVYNSPKLNAKNFPAAFGQAELRVKPSKANMRVSPDTKSDVVISLIQGEKLLVLGQSKDWIHVVNELGVKGFVHKSIVQT